MFHLSCTVYFILFLISNAIALPFDGKVPYKCTSTSSNVVESQDDNEDGDAFDMGSGAILNSGKQTG